VNFETDARARPTLGARTTDDSAWFVQATLESAKRQSAAGLDKTNLLNQVAKSGYDEWQVEKTQSIFGKSFAPFALVEGKNFMECDLVYLAGGMLFWGARHFDGRGFDSEENRPTNLQIPLARK